MSNLVFSCAGQLRLAYEHDKPNHVIGDRVIELIKALGGNESIYMEAVIEGRHSAATCYLIALMLAQEPR